ncbi:hypothetical protein V6N13_076830 [Hibiscus sabdariffa]|uniref:RNase H type-1 domain-containing protein n=2 Tax=Hibiscus sabdariffa TaxID=183260 RepID=A0ABR2CM16_9ROSI
MEESLIARSRMLAQEMAAASVSQRLSGSELCAFHNIAHIYQLLSEDWVVTIDYIERAHNKLTNLLVKRAYGIAGKLHVFMDPPAFIHDCFYEEQSMVAGNCVNPHLGIGLGGLVHVGGASSNGIG